MSRKFVVCHGCKTVLLFPQFYGVNVLVKQVWYENINSATLYEYREYCFDCYDESMTTSEDEEYTINIRDNDDLDDDLGDYDY